MYNTHVTTKDTNKDRTLEIARETMFENGTWTLINDQSEQAFTGRRGQTLQAISQPEGVICVYPIITKSYLYGCVDTHRRRRLYEGLGSRGGKSLVISKSCTGIPAPATSQSNATLL